MSIVKNKKSWEIIKFIMEKNVNDYQKGIKSFKEAMNFSQNQLEVTKMVYGNTTVSGAHLDSLFTYISRLDKKVLKIISFKSTKITDTELEALAHILDDIEIDEFDLSHCKKLTSVACLGNLKIKNLILTGSTNITDISSL